MCKTVATLAKIDRFHRLTCCDHGVVHLVWHTLSISMREEDFHTAAEELDYAARMINQGFDRPSDFAERINNRVHIQFDDLTLRIHITKFNEFVTLFARASERLRTQSVKGIIHGQAAKRLPYRPLPPAYSFSMN